MLIVCPCCRATNESATCRRCKADLQLMRQCDAALAHHTAAGAVAMHAQQWAKAQQHYRYALQLRATPEAHAALALVELLRGDDAAARHHDARGGHA